MAEITGTSYELGLSDGQSDIAGGLTIGTICSPTKVSALALLPAVNLDLTASSECIALHIMTVMVIWLVGAHI